MKTPQQLKRLRLYKDRCIVKLLDRQGSTGLKHWKLVNGRVTPCTMGQWCVWFERHQNSIKRNRVGEAEISTICLGIDHSWGRSSPVLFETMVFGGPMDGVQQRYSTRARALKGHWKLVEDNRNLRRYGKITMTAREGEAAAILRQRKNFEELHRRLAETRLYHNQPSPLQAGPPEPAQ